MTEPDRNPTVVAAVAAATSPFPSTALGEPDPRVARTFQLAGITGIQIPETLPGDAALIVVKRGPNAGSRFVLDRPVVTAGRHPNSDIFLDDITVSRRHVEFRRQDGRFQVVDVGSLNGTFVNRKPVQAAVLANGDEIHIGRFRLVFLR